ncbi:hypothetical protein AYK20_00995 [Thermoplasmatales archaeon SG8-52-1]|nr:MAG: hypothetical protein AYK20_00995 [Thermoplasmatales archaeon SG8-52-1]
MPGGDRTGPLGRGSMTGRAMGYCAGYEMPGYANPNYPGRGIGFGFGRGFGRRYWRHGRGFWKRGFYPYPYYSTEPSIEEEKTYLENSIKELEEEIKHIHERLKELSKEKKEES